MISAKQHTIKSSKGEITNVEVGKDLSRVLSSEIARLNHPLLKYDFLARYANGKLLQYSLKSKETVRKGDFVICIDLSGTMHKFQRELWAKAISLALTISATKQKRKVSIIAFSENVKDVFTFEKPPTIEEIVKLAEIFYGGGTNFEEPLKKATELIQNNIPN